MSTGVYSNTTSVVATRRVRKQKNLNRSIITDFTNKFGVKGADGVNGRDGRDGKDGKDGLIGPAGQNGLNGRDGKDGAVGAKGDKGDKGEPAFSLTGFGYSSTSQLNLSGESAVQIQGGLFNYINGGAINQTNMTITVNGGEIWAFELIVDGITTDIFPVRVDLKIGGNKITSVVIQSKDLLGFQEPGCAVVRGTSVANIKHTIPAGTNTLMLSSNVACLLTDFMVIGHRIQ